MWITDILYIIVTVTVAPWHTQMSKLIKLCLQKWAVWCISVFFFNEKKKKLLYFRNPQRALPKTGMTWEVCYSTQDHRTSTQPVRGRRRNSTFPGLSFPCALDSPSFSAFASLTNQAGLCTCACLHFPDVSLWLAPSASQSLFSCST